MWCEFQLRQIQIVKANVALRVWVVLMEITSHRWPWGESENKHFLLLHINFIWLRALCIFELAIVSPKSEFYIFIFVTFKFPQLSYEFILFVWTYKKL